MDAVRTAKKGLDTAKKGLDEALADRRIFASDLHNKGHTFTEIGRILGISRQRAHQILRRPAPAPGRGRPGRVADGI
jgi:DNA-directed RNA polymerase sigma subunit (sigma70/sigma32)